MVDENLKDVVEFVGKAVTSAAIVLGILWRFLDKMITEKVKEQLQESMAQITKSTSGEIHQLRQEIRENRENSIEQKQDQTHEIKLETQEITRRIDQLFVLLTGRKS